MPNTFKPKRSNVASSIPTTGDLVDGEIAVNSSDKIIYIRDGGAVTELANFSSGGGAAGEEIRIEDNDSTVGTAGTINFGSGLSVTPSSQGIVTVTASSITADSYWALNDVGIHTLSNVGIGSTIPTASLSVEGDIFVTGTGIVTATTFKGDFDGDGSNITGISTLNIVDYGQFDITADSYWALNDVGIHTLSNVGIGSTLPTASLSVEGDVFVTGTGIVTATSFVGSGANLTNIITSVTAGDGISVEQIPGSTNVTVSSEVTEHKILDDISSSFDGSTTQFTISSSTIKFLNTEITTAARLLISVGGIVQQPDPTQTNGYYISGGTDIVTDPIVINFVEAPKAGQIFFGVAYGLTTNPTSTFLTAEQSLAYSITFGV